MQEQNNINFIKEETIDNNSIIEINDDVSNASNSIQNISTDNSSNIFNNEEIIKDLPTWDINPPLEVVRGEK